jgi:tetratricopeptide (TPR) repeat protein
MNALKRHLLLLSATLWTGLCLALPAPHDIEQAVAQGHLTQAEQMLREVIAEKPGSAKAHYELAQVLSRQGQHSQALQAIGQARALDPSLKFAQSADKFNAVARAIEQQAQAAPASASRALTSVNSAPAAHPSAAPNAAESASWLWPALLTGGFALLVLAWWRRTSARPLAQAPAAGMAGYSESPRGFGAQFDPRGNASAYGNTYGNPYPAPSPTGGSGVAGAVVGGLAGVAAGYALSKALEDHDRPAPHSEAAAPRPVSPMEDVGLVRMDDPGNATGSFDAGTGDSWDAPASDDSW